MKKYLLYPLLIITALAVVACSKDDDDENIFNKEDEKEEIENEFNANSEVRVTLEKDKYVWHFTFSSNLHTKFPYSNIEHCVAWGLDENNDGELDYYTFDKRACNGECTLDVYPVKYHCSADLAEVFALYKDYNRTYDVLQEKLASGQSLTSSEWDLYYEIVDFLDKNTDRYFTTEPFIKIDGKVYKLTVDRIY
ncbi:MAG: hypothetical protein E7088_07985 [Bacteroidales bacterium]|nr:hypothetical protein [Bacteroidales bacterium]